MKRDDIQKIRDAEAILRSVLARTSANDRAFGTLRTAVWWTDEAARTALPEAEPTPVAAAGQDALPRTQGAIKAPVTKGAAKPTSRPPGAT